MSDESDTIAKVMIDEMGRLLIFPTVNTYSMIYREAVEVNWDDHGKYLYSPKPGEWTYFDWFKHIVTTAGDLVLSLNTIWENIPVELRSDAEVWMKVRT
jgi:hypothetical protein